MTTTNSYSQEARDLFPKGLKHVERDLDPVEAIRLVKRLKRDGNTLFVRFEAPLTTHRSEECGRRFYDVPGSLKVTLPQAIECLKDRADFNEVKERAGQPTGKVRILRHGRCCFIGG